MEMTEPLTLQFSVVFKKSVFLKNSFGQLLSQEIIGK